MSAAQQRLAQIKQQLKPSDDAKTRILRKDADDIVVTLACRTPLTKARKGALKDTSLEDMVIPLLQTVRERSNLDPSLVEEIVFGNVLNPNAAYAMRGASLVAGFPATTATSIASRWCSSGLLAVQSVANQILSNAIDVGIAVGAESMSTNPDNGSAALSTAITEHPEAKDIIKPMGWTSENVAGDFGVSREKQDAYAARSHQNAEAAQKAGWPTQDEIVPLTTQWTDSKTGKTTTVVLDRDEGPRHGTTADGLSKLRAAFPQWKPSTTTGGNASQLTDGAAAVLLMRRRTAESLGQPIVGKFVASTVVGLEPRIMGIGPVYAIPKLMNKIGLSMQDVDIFEINEAFASMAVYCLETLGIDRAKMNPRGGAIALGHPLGCTGARQIVTALAELKRTQKRIAVTSMCVGTGQGMASLIVSES